MASLVPRRRPPLLKGGKPTGRPGAGKLLYEAVQQFVDVLDVHTLSERNAFTTCSYDWFEESPEWLVVRGCRVSRSTGVVIDTWHAFWIERCSGDVYTGHGYGQYVQNVYGPRYGEKA